MLNETQTSDSDEPPSPEGHEKPRLHVITAADADSSQPSPETTRERPAQGLLERLKTMVKGRADTNLREALEGYIDEASGADGLSSMNDQEHALLTNILKLRDMTVVDVMIPRVDIVALHVDTSQQDLFSLLAERQYSRIPVYRETLDDVLGTIHIKDILAALAQGKPIAIADLVREAPIVSPSLPVLDLLLMMKQKKRHIVLVVDEYGGIDGLATIGDIVEAIFGEIEDKYDQDTSPRLVVKDSGAIEADGRLDIESFEKHVGAVLTEDEREDVDTLGGLIFAMAGRIPARGEIVTHESGMVFEVLDADLRRVKLVLVRNIPSPDS